MSTLSTTPPAPGPADSIRPESLAFLKELLDTPSPSGFEREGQRVWMKYARQFATKAWNDSYNNCFASFGPEGKDVPTLAICGHADEIGLMVNHFDDKGFVYAKAIGGIDVGSIVGKRVRFNSSVSGVKNPVIGLIGATAIHLQDKSQDGKVRKRSAEHQLNPKLSRLLLTFMQRQGEVIPRKFLMQHIWETTYMGDTRTLDVHIRWLRKVIEDDPSAPNYLKTIRGQGYRFDNPKQKK